MNFFKEFYERFVLAMQILFNRDSSFVKYVQMELSIHFSGAKDDITAWMMRDLINFARVFSLGEHSGFSASYMRGCINKLIAYEPLGPLTGEDSEWCKLDYDSDLKYQNKRCSHVFKNAEGRVYDIQAIVFREPYGVTFTNRHSKMFVELPYTPSAVYADVPANASNEVLQEAANHAWAMRNKHYSN